MLCPEGSYNPECSCCQAFTSLDAGNRRWLDFKPDGTEKDPEAGQDRQPDPDVHRRQNPIGGADHAPDESADGHRAPDHRPDRRVHPTLHAIWRYRLPQPDLVDVVDG